MPAERSTADAWQACLDRITAAGRDAGWPWLFTRCWLLAQRHEQHHTGDPAAFGVVLDAFDELPEGVPGRARLAVHLVNLALRCGAGTADPAESDRIAALVTAGDGDPAPLPQWPADRAVARARWLTVALHHGRAGVDPGAALAELDGLAAVVGALGPHARMVDVARLAVRHVVARDAGDLTGMTGAVGALGGTEDVPGGEQEALSVLGAVQEVSAGLHGGDAARTAAGLAELERLRDDLAPGSTARRHADDTIQHAEAALQVLTAAGAHTGSPDDLPLDPDPDGRHAARARERLARPGLSDAGRAGLLAELGIWEVGRGGAALDDGVEHLREAVELTTPASWAGIAHRAGHGWALVLRYEERRRSTDLAAGIAALEEARDLAGGPEHPHWATMMISLGHAYRLAGEKQRGNATGRDALRGHTASVLLQSGTASATAGARDAAGEAVDVARWHLHDDDAAGAALALDAGRGLVLRAAVQFGDLEGRLTARGAGELAARWQREGGADRAPAALRAEVLAALGGAGLDPPALSEVQRAVAELGLDALVYLVPGDEKAGAAVLVTATGRPSWIPLPRLSRGAAAPLHRYLAADTGHGFRSDRAADRDMDPVVATTAGWAEALHDVCGWAWDAAMGPLLGRLLARLPTGRAARLALVPMGELARVPWHAARDAAGDYAVQRAAVTYAVSARSLCDAARAEAPSTSGAGLVVADPDTEGVATELAAARVEAAAIRAAFYPRARYLGRNPDGSAAGDGRGSRAEVEHWLTDDAPEAGSVLHAACHGMTASGAGAMQTSALLLAGGERLAAEDLVHALATRPGREVSLAVLAACSSGVSGRGYDEAFSLATALLTSGTRTVISAMWRVPDSATSVLMYLFHHFVRERPPMEALRTAQLWMLCPDQRTRVELPDAVRAELTRGDATDPVAWAGFAHAGR